MGNKSSCIDRAPPRTRFALLSVSRQGPRFWQFVFVLGILDGFAVRWAFHSADPPLHRQTGAIL